MIKHSSSSKVHSKRKGVSHNPDCPTHFLFIKTIRWISHGSLLPLICLSASLQCKGIIFTYHLGLPSSLGLQVIREPTGVATSNHAALSFGTSYRSYIWLRNRLKRHTAILCRIMISELDAEHKPTGFIEELNNLGPISLSPWQGGWN